MIKELIHDEAFLSQVSEESAPEDMQTARDLEDTLRAHSSTCVGMAANMIGIKKRIIVIDDNNSYVTMFNPVIIKCSQPYTAEESCLSLLGGPRKIKRYKYIKLKYQNDQFKLRYKSYTGWTAQIIQHEIDHCNGILI